MVTRRYTADYRLENRLTASGRLRTEAVYCGRYFAFDAPPETVARMRRVYTVCTALALAALAGMLSLPAPVGHAWYAVLPAAAGVFPAGMCAASLLRLWRAGGRCTREHRDKTGQRYAAASFFVMLTGAAGLAGSLVFAVREGAGGFDLLFSALAAVYAAAGAVMFAFRRRLSMHELPDAPE